jgi:photosystem II stability/assembly factor-like uncharacterized protein
MSLLLYFFWANKSPGASIIKESVRRQDRTTDFLRRTILPQPCEGFEVFCIFGNMKNILLRKYLLFLFSFGFLTISFSQKRSKPSVAEIQGLPQWAQEMYKEKPNVFEVDKLYSAHYRTVSFVKNYHTQYYKYWRRSVQDHIDENGWIIEKTPEQVQQELGDYLNQFPQKNSNWTVSGPLHTQAGNNNQASDQTNVYCIDQCAGNPAVLYLGTEPGEVFKSIDGGNNWTSVSMTMNFGGTNAIEVHPTDGNIVFVGGDLGIFRSTDGGQNWTNVMPENGLGVNEILIQPTNTQIVIAATQKGLYRSTDGGTTWTQLYTQKCYDLKCKPDDPNVIYLLKNNPAQIICEFFKSTDSGASWQLQSNGWYTSTDPARTDGGGRLAVTPADPNRVYAYLIGESKLNDYGYIGVFRSDNAGASWLLPNGPAGGPYTATHLNLAYGNPDWTYHQGFYNCAILASPTDADKILVGGLNLYSSTDGGASFSSLAGYVGGPLSIHVDMQDFRQVNGNTWITTDGGAYLSTNFCATQPSFKMDGVRGSDFWGFGSGWNEDVQVGGLYHNGNLGHHENYGLGNFLQLGGGEAPTGYVNPGQNKKTYFSDIGGRYLPANYSDAGIYFQFGIAPNESYWGAESSELEFHPNCYNTLFTGNANKLWKSTDGGGSFNQLYAFGPNPDSRITYMEISSQNPDKMYVCQRPPSGSVGYLWRTLDGGTTWEQLSPPTGNSRRMLVTLNPENDQELWIAYPDGANNTKVFHSTNSGMSWNNLSSSALNNQYIHSLVYIAGTNGGLYAATNNAVYYRNATTNWVLDNAGLPTFTNGNILRPFYRDGKIRLASYGKGIWESALNEAPDHPICRIMVDKLEQTVLCAADSFYFEDHSFLNHINATWSWSFPTGSPSNSNLRNPSVFFATPGNHLAVLTITDQFGNTDQDSITVTVANYQLPTIVNEDFEGMFTPNGWYQTNPDNGGQWSLSTSTGGFSNSVQSALYDNYNIDSQGTTDDLNVSVNAQNMSSLDLTFDVAYAPWGGSYSDTLAVLVSTNCGSTFTQVYFKGGLTLATAPTNNSFFTPSATEWRTESIDLYAFTGNDKVIVAFRNKGHWGNALYLDNVNLSNNLDQQVLLGEDVGIYPNPICPGTRLNVAGIEGECRLKLFDHHGKLVKDYGTVTGGSVLLDGRMKTGMYMVRIETENRFWNKTLYVQD